MQEMRESGIDPLEKEMATHSCILAWRIPWTEEPGGSQWSTVHGVPKSQTHQTDSESESVTQSCATLLQPHDL